MALCVNICMRTLIFDVYILIKLNYLAGMQAVQTRLKGPLGIATPNRSGQG